jgi:hypothetical protein
VKFNSVLVLLTGSVGITDCVLSALILRLYFYFGVLHPVARTLLRLLEEPSLVARGGSDYMHVIFTLCFHFTHFVKRTRKTDCNEWGYFVQDNTH